MSEVYKARRVDSGEEIEFNIFDVEMFNDKPSVWRKLQGDFIEIDPETLVQVSGKAVDERNKYKLRCSYLKEIFNSVDDEVKEQALKNHEKKLGQSFANAICKEMREKKKAIDNG